MLKTTNLMLLLKICSSQSRRLQENGASQLKIVKVSGSIPDCINVHFEPRVWILGLKAYMGWMRFVVRNQYQYLKTFRKLHCNTQVAEKPR